MGRENVLFKSEEKKTGKEVSDMLRRIADKIDEGSLTLKKGDEEIIVTFPNQMVLELKVEEEQGRKLKTSFEIELEWVPGESSDESTSIL